jgi:bifunctional polynucleotide phosphatase/kinase
MLLKIRNNNFLSISIPTTSSASSESSYQTNEDTESSWDSFERDIFDGSAISTSTIDKNIKIRIEDICQKKRIPTTSNVLQYWDIIKLSDPELAEIAEIVLAAPATQVSVERSFSGLKLVLSPQRTNLSGKN